MADNTERIEQQIAQAREDLASTLDQLAERANPQRLAEDAKARATDTLNKPVVKFSLIGLVALVAIVAVRTVRRNREDRAIRRQLQRGK